jgi:hypothetical protein
MLIIKKFGIMNEMDEWLDEELNEQYLHMKAKALSKVFRPLRKLSQRLKAETLREPFRPFRDFPQCLKAEDLWQPFWSFVDR